MSFFVVSLLILKKKLDPGISRNNGQYCPVIPGYVKALKTLNPNLNPSTTGFLLLACQIYISLPLKKLTDCLSNLIQTNFIHKSGH